MCEGKDTDMRKYGAGINKECVLNNDSMSVRNNECAGKLYKMP